MSQELLSVREPNLGALSDDVFVDEADEIGLEALVAPRVEAEVAFVVAGELAGPGATTTRSRPRHP
jgi:2-keto-4-pentenoate hydratase